jgi:hypothetical protein
MEADRAVDMRLFPGRTGRFSVTNRGIKPLPIAIPETGKLLLLTGVLPPERVGVELEVKGKR